MTWKGCSLNYEINVIVGLVNSCVCIITQSPVLYLKLQYANVFQSLRRKARSMFVLYYLVYEKNA